MGCLRTNSSTQEQVKYNGKNTFHITEGVSNKKMFDGASGSGKSTILWYTNKLQLINDGYPIQFNIENPDLGNMCVQRNPANFSQIFISNIVMITESSSHDKTYMRHNGGYPVHTKRKSDLKITGACGHTNKPNNNVENFSDRNKPNDKTGYDNFCGWSLRLLNFDGGNPVSGFVKSTKKNKSVSLYETLLSLNIPRARSEMAYVKNQSIAKLNNVGSICSEQNSNLTFYLQSKQNFALYHPGLGKTTCSCLTIGLQTIGALNNYTIVMWKLHISIFQREFVASQIFTEMKMNLNNNLYGWQFRLRRNDGGNPASGLFRYWWSNKVPRDVIFVYEIFESLITGASSKIHVKILNVGSKQNSDLTLCQQKNFCCHPGSGKLRTKERRENCTKRKIKSYDMHSKFCGWSLRLLNLTIGDNQDNVVKKYRYWYQSSCGLMPEDCSDLINNWVNAKQLPFRNGVNIITTVALEQKSNVDKWSYWGSDTSLHSACKNGHWHTKALHISFIEYSYSKLLCGGTIWNCQAYVMKSSSTMDVN